MNYVPTDMVHDHREEMEIDALEESQPPELVVEIAAELEEINNQGLDTEPIEEPVVVNLPTTMSTPATIHNKKVEEYISRSR